MQRPVSPTRSPFGSARTRPLTACLALIGSLVLCIGGAAPDARAEEAPVDRAIAQIDAFIEKNPPVNRKSPRWKTRLVKPPKLEFDPKRTYTWKLETNVGEVRFRLLPEIAPMHVSSTIYLTRLGFYDGTQFHRVIKGFMAQGGDPLGNGRGGPGYRYAGEFNATARHDAPGILSMANAGPNTDGSQFFITFKPTPQLDNRHTVFGRAESPESLKTMRAMEALGRPRDPAPPLEPLFIKEAKILIE